MLKPLNPILHSELRLAIMSILIATQSADFVYLRTETGATAGNLSVQLDKLQRAGYIEIEKGFNGKLPRTTCSMSDKGREAMREYIETLQEYLGTAIKSR
ncbi:MAG: transcriptional regulator [Alistipes sp.]|nr:transcriptional regulator [Alistipes sp.]